MPVRMKLLSRVNLQEACQAAIGPEKREEMACRRPEKQVRPGGRLPGRVANTALYPHRSRNCEPIGSIRGAAVNPARRSSWHS